jgi:hypothetical protein
MDLLSSLRAFVKSYPSALPDKNTESVVVTLGIGGAYSHKCPSLARNGVVGSLVAAHHW